MSDAILPQEVLIRNLRETFEAMCAMRDCINEHIPMPSLESDLLQGPENSVFCAAVAQAVVAEVARLKAEIERLHKLVRWNVTEDGNLVRLCRGEHDKSEPCGDHEEVFVPVARIDEAEQCERMAYNAGYVDGGTGSPHRVTGQIGVATGDWEERT